MVTHQNKFTPPPQPDDIQQKTDSDPGNPANITGNLLTTAGLGTAQSEHLQDLAATLVGAFVRGGGEKAALPEGRREEYLALLTRLMIDTPLRREFVTALDQEVRRQGVHGALLHLASPGLPAEAVVAGGLSVLSDEQLADLALHPVALVCLHELIDEMLLADKAGKAWWDAIDAAAVPADYGPSGLAKRTVERLKALDEFMHSPTQTPSPTD